MPDITDDILFASVREQGKLIREQKISPVALTEAYLERLAKIGPRYNAVVTLTRDLAQREAKAAEAEIKAGKYRGPLHGIPYGVKDIAATKGIPTTWGAEPFKNQVFDHDATVVTKLREAGAVLLGKLAMVELAGGFNYNNADASFTGPGLNPWDTAFWSGGSSSGPGSAVSAALVSFAVGSETSGSIITPASFCGISGLRPTYGRVSRHGCMALSWTLDKIGPMCRSADDCGLVLAALAGPDPLDPASADRPFKYEEVEKPEQGKKFKIGVIKGATAGIQPEVRKNFNDAVKVLGEFCDVEENVQFPDLPFGPVVSTIINAEGASAFRDFIDAGGPAKLRAVHDKYGGYAGMTILAVDYLHAMRARGKMKKALDDLYSKYDALVAPARSTVANPINLDFDKAYAGASGPPVIPAGNVVGQPALSVPDGFGMKNLPTGIQFTGRNWSEGKLIAIAHAYQQATDWHKKRPPKVG
ncbi:amidase [Planctomycetaceae bacterium SCGC AG-212-F19]|nr:amidase [Planctomycetaceae bacterium SCGC AG-212-F19]